jgi:hypothetical protein
MNALNRVNIPAALHHLIPVAENWGISDDYDRETKIRQATEPELRALIASIDEETYKDVWSWLCGPEASSPTPSDEYAAFTCLTMAIDAAKVKLNSAGR